MKLLVWGPLPPSPSGIADYLQEQLAPLAARVELHVVVEDPRAVACALPRGVSLHAPESVPPADLDLYQLGNSPAHAYVYRAALRRPGVLLMHDWSLHHLVLQETVERGERDAYLRLMRRAYHDTGVYLGRQIAMGLGGQLLPALFPLNEHVLDASLALVGLSEALVERAGRVFPDRPLLHLKHHLSLPFGVPPSRELARRELGLDPEALIVAAPGLATSSKRLEQAVRVIARLRRRHPRLLLHVVGAVEEGLPLEEWARAARLNAGLVVTGRLSLEDFVRQVAAADVVLALRFPSHGEMSGALVRALGLGKPVLVTAGTPVAREFPEGLTAHVDPGLREEALLEALLERLLQSPELRARMGRLAARHVRREHALEDGIDRLVAFLEGVLAQRGELERRLRETHAPEGSLRQYLLDELRSSARELGLQGASLGVAPLLEGLAGERP